MHSKKWIVRISILVAYCFLWIGLVGCRGLTALPGETAPRPLLASHAVFLQPAQFQVGDVSFSPAAQQDPAEEDGIIPDTGRPVNNQLLAALALVAVIGVALLVLALFSKG
jgi:hypothetical protein